MSPIVGVGIAATTSTVMAHGRTRRTILNWFDRIFFSFTASSNHKDFVWVARRKGRLNATFSWWRRHSINDCLFLVFMTRPASMTTLIWTVASTDYLLWVALKMLTTPLLSTVFLFYNANCLLTAKPTRHKIISQNRKNIQIQFIKSL